MFTISKRRHKVYADPAINSWISTRRLTVLNTGAGTSSICDDVLRNGHGRMLEPAVPALDKCHQSTVENVWAGQSLRKTEQIPSSTEVLRLPAISCTSHFELRFLQPQSRGHSGSMEISRAY